jgi:peptide/nickel transport system permease protein
MTALALRRNRGVPSVGVAAIVILILMTGLTLLAPLIAPHAEADFIGGVWEDPSANAWLGTDNLGRDILSRLLYGGRISINVAFIATALSCIIGSILGFTAAVSSTAVDNVLSRAVDALMSVPKLIMALVVLSVLGTSFPIMIGTIAILDSTRFFRLSRLVAKRIYSFDFVEAARLRGEGLGWVITREILPNAWPPLLAEFGIRFGLILLFVASLSFLGLGVQPPHADWGIMVRENAAAISLGKIAPFAPAFAIALMAICVNLAVDWFVAKRGDISP